MSITNKKQDIEKLKQELLSYQKDLEFHSQKFKEELDNIRKDMMNKASDYFSESINTAESISKNSASLIQDLGSENEKVLKNDFTKLQQNMIELFDKYHDNISKTQNKADELLKKQNEFIDSEKSNFYFSAKPIFDTELQAVTNLQEQYNNVVKQTREKFINFLEREEANFKDSATSLEFIGSELKEFHSKAKIITQEIENKLAQLFLNATTDVGGHFEQSVQTVRNSADELINNLTEESVNRKKAIEEIKTELIKKVNDDIEKSISNQQDIKETFDTSINSFSSNQIEAFNNILEGSSERFSKELELKKAETIQDIDDIRKDFRENLYTGLNDISTGFTSFQEVFIDQIESLITTLQKQSEEMQSSLQEIVIKRIGEVQNIAETMETKLENLAESNNKNFIDQYNQLKNDFDAEMQTKSKEFAESVQKLNLEIKDIFSKSQETTKNELKSTNVSLNNTLAVEFDNSSIFTDKMLNKYKDGTSTYVSNQSNLLNETNTKTINDLDKNKEELIANIASLEPEFEKLTEIQGKKVQEKNKEILDLIDRSSNEVHKELESLETNAIQEISQLNLVIEGEVNERSEELQSKIESIIENLMKNEKNQLTEFTEDLSNKVLNTLDEINELKPTSISEIEKHITDYANKINSMVTTQQNNQTTIEKNIRGFEAKIKKSKEELNNNIDLVSNNSDNTLKNMRKRSKKIIDKTDEILKKME